MNISQGAGFQFNTPSKSNSLPKNTVFTLQKQLQQATKNLQKQKRKFMQTQQDYLKILKIYNQQRDTFNNLKKSRIDINIKTIPIKTNNLYNNSNKINVENQNVLGKITNLKKQMDTCRRQRLKHIELCDRLNLHIQQMENSIKMTDQNIQNIKMSNQILKNQILQCRQKSLQDIKGFRSTFTGLTQNYFSDRKFLQSQIKQSRLQQGQDFQVNALPVLKQRLRIIISKNKQKLKISNEYKKTSQQIRKMFQAIQDFKGQQQVMFIARQFVQKQNAIYKLQEYVSQLESRLATVKKLTSANLQSNVEDQNILHKQNQRIINIKEKRIEADQIRDQILQIQKKTQNIQKNFQKISPIFQDSIVKLRQSKYNQGKQKPEEVKITFTLMKSNIMKVLGEIQKYIGIANPPKTVSKLSAKLFDAIRDEGDPNSGSPPPNIINQQNQLLMRHQLFSYQKLKEMANEYLSSRTGFSDTKRK